MPETKRLFVALHVPDHIQEKISQLKSIIAGVVWHPSQNFHITVKFIGDTSTEQLSGLENLMNFTGRNFPAFEIGFKSFKVVESRLRLLVVNPEQLKNIRATLDHNLKKINLTHDDPLAFEPHITLGKVARDFSVPQIDFDFSAISFKADTLTVFETMKGQGAPVFKMLKEVGLSGQ